MRSLLWFLLGFMLVFAWGVAYAAYPGQCTRILYTQGEPDQANGSIYMYSGLDFDSAAGLLKPTGYGQHERNGSYYIRAMLYYYDIDRWWNKSSTQNTRYVAGVSPPDGAVAIPDILQTTIDAALGTGCGPNQECPDSDSDGVCDQCDPNPEDSTKGLKEYVHGFYEYNGNVVAYQHDDDADASNGYMFTMLDNSAPGAVLGGGGGIDEETFTKAGGTYTAFATGELVATRSCPPVTSQDECGELPCGYDFEDAAEDLGDWGNNQEDIDEAIKGGQSAPPDLEERAKDAPFLETPDRDCGSYNDMCAKACGGTAHVRNFGCAGDSGQAKSVRCECREGEGAFYLAPEYGHALPEGSDPNPTIDGVVSGSSGSSTVDMGTPGSGQGDDGPGGGPTDGDADGTIDGYAAGERTVNFAPLMQGASELGGKFPFSLVTTAREMAEQFDAVGQCPKFDFSVMGHAMVIDLCMFDPVATIVRTLFGLVFAVGIYWAAMRFFV